MTNGDVLKLKLIETVLATVDTDDEKDARQAVELIRTLLEAGEKKA